MDRVSTMNERSSERGNVLFLILIAVALFAALSYAVTQSTRSGAGSSDNETGLINSAQLTQYPAGVRTAVVRMIIGGVDTANLSFNVPSDFSNLTNTDWGVFFPSGGGATYAPAPGEVMANGGQGPWVFNSENEINLVGTTVGGNNPDTNSADIIAFLPGIAQSVCARINDELGITGTPVESSIDVATAMIDDGTGPSGIGGGGGTIGDDVTELDGQPFGCFRNGAAGPFVYYHVLVER